VTAGRLALELSFGDEDLSRITTRARSRERNRQARARMLLAHSEDHRSSGWAVGVHHQVLRRASCDLWSVDGARRSAAAWEGADHQGGGLVGGSGLVARPRELGLSARIMDDAAAGASAGERGPAVGHDRLVPGHSVQDSQQARAEATQGALLPGTP
jgi:hypothetical protein